MTSLSNTESHLLARGSDCSLSSWDLLIKRQYIRQRSDWCDRERVDLLVTLGIVAFNVDKVGGLAAKRFMVPVQVAQPPEHNVSMESRAGRNDKILV